MVNQQSVGAAESTDCISTKGLGSTHKCPGYDIKQSVSKAPVTQEPQEMQSTPLLPSLTGPLCPKGVAPDRVPPMG